MVILGKKANIPSKKPAINKKDSIDKIMIKKSLLDLSRLLIIVDENAWFHSEGAEN